MRNISHDVHIHIEKDEHLQIFIHTIPCAYAKRVRDGLGWYLLGTKIEQDHSEMINQCVFRFLWIWNDSWTICQLVTHPFVFILFLWFMNSTNIRWLSYCKLYETTKEEFVATTMHRQMHHTLTCGKCGKGGNIISSCTWEG